jgi:replication factor C subunit 3/5|tara:strand:- start:4868 stop:5812 length:945 start_codon:yes stop_codon:yes gene_type:complete
MNKFSPWVEKYRPSSLNDVVLDNTNKQILNNILNKKYFPNLLFYGPPGTGKTTTIINLINAYQKKYNQTNKGFKIHLNASDDRGIEIIRNQIYQFVHTKTLFGEGLKFVILDEVDYMTKNAQQALRYLIQKYSGNVRFCLICNYISRIDTALQNEFIRLRFCQLPSEDISRFLKKIINKEQLKINDNQLYSIQNSFKSDIRSMINYIQANHKQFAISTSYTYITADVWESIINKLKNNDPEDIIPYFSEISVKYNIEKVDLLQDFINYLIKTKPYALVPKWISVFKFVIHSEITNSNYLIPYTVYNLKELYKLL